MGERSEAVGIVDRILVWETDKARFAFPEIPFRSFADIESLSQILLGDVGCECEFTPSGIAEQALWASGWEQNFQTFLQSLGVAREQ